MKISGRIVLQKTPSRTKNVSEDYFLSLEITQIDNQPIKTTEDMFAFMKDKLPEIYIGNELINSIFSNPFLPPQAKNVPHITIGNFPDFRVGRDVNNGHDMALVNKARAMEGDTLTFDMTAHDFEIAVATEDADLISHLKPNNQLIKFKNGSANIDTARTVGQKRDAILSLKPNEEGQNRLKACAAQVFGEGFVLWNADKKPVPRSATIAQTDQLLAKLVVARQAIPQNDSATTNYSFKA